MRLLPGEIIKHLDFSALVLINKEVVALTGEAHEHDEEDDRKLKALAKEVSESFSEQDFESRLVKEASLLAYKLATGQHFHEGNKRTALVAASAFLQMNGRSMNIKDDALVAVIDRAGVGRATLNEVQEAIGRLVRNE